MVLSASGKMESTNNGLTAKVKMQQLHLNQVGPYVKTRQSRQFAQMRGMRQKRRVGTKMEGCKVKLMMEHKTDHLCLMMAGWETGKWD